MKCFSCFKNVDKERAVLFNGIQVCATCKDGLSKSMGKNKFKKEKVRSFKYKAYIWFLFLSSLSIIYLPKFVFYLVLDTFKFLFKKNLPDHIEFAIKIKDHHIL